MKLKESCARPTTPLFAHLPDGTVYKSESGKILLKVKSKVGDYAYCIDPITGKFVGDGLEHKAVLQVYPNATLVLEG